MKINHECLENCDASTRCPPACWGVSHFLCKFLPKYSGGQVIRLIKSITAREVFKGVPEIKRELWGGEFWTDGYYFATVSGRGDRKVIEKYIEGQGRVDDVKQLRLFEL
ncbi:MAG: IS200/IS605 family transposase [Chloroflexota bacterium]